MHKSLKTGPRENRRSRSTLARVGKYTLVRATVLLITVIVAVYAMILVANLGGYVDEVVRSNIEFAIGMGLRGSGETSEERLETFERLTEAAYEAAGLNQPFLLRSARWLRRGLTLDWGETTTRSGVGSGSRRPVREVVGENLPRTLLIFGTANLLLFFITILLALPLTRKHGGWLDRVVIGLSPLSAAPAWVYGIILNVVSLKVLGSVFSGGAFDSWPEQFHLSQFPILVRHMALPAGAIFLSGLFHGVYLWRSLFSLHSQEDYVEMARAKGLPQGQLGRQYILRPLLPSVLTSFAFLFVSLWQEVIVLEHVFHVSGIGRLLLNGIRRYDTPLIVALVVTFAYLLAITVFVLDILYALVDPRVRIGGERQAAKAVSKRGWPHLQLRWPWELFQRRSAPEDRVREEGRGEEEGDAGGWREGASSGSEALDRILQGQVSRGLASLVATLRGLSRYPLAAFGLFAILAMIGLSTCTIVVLPHDEMVHLWRGSPDVWIRNPRAVPPAWVNLFRKETLPSTVRMSSGDLPSARGVSGALSQVRKETAVISEDMMEILIAFPFDFEYDAFPQDVAVFVKTRFEQKRPLVSFLFVTPEGREFELGSETIERAYTYRLSQDERLLRRIAGQDQVESVFAAPGVDPPIPLNGRYELQVKTFVFEEHADADAELVVYGQVHGLAGTDARGRDLLIPLLWGMPVALAFGLVAAVGTSVSAMAAAGVGVWFGGWVDSLLQRVSEVSMLLPFLPVSLMVYTLYSKSIWAILGVAVLLTSLGQTVKTYRAIFLQVKEAPYVEAAQAYGARGWRIVFRYLIPRIMPVLIPQLVILVPSYVFLEATLTVLGVSDPVLPTWGKLVVDGLSRGIHTGELHTLLQPLGLLLLIAFAFVLVGVALERVFEPRLREG